MPLSWIYGKIADLRNRLYDSGTFESQRLGARTISIGNLSTGGTGKTPLVAYVATVLADRGEKVCVLSRGYGRKDPKKRVLVSNGDTVLANVRDAGDEPFELASKLLGKAMVIADADRLAAAEWAKRKHNVTAFVLDDAFQHRRAARDIDIVCVDATKPFGRSKMLPFGRLREPLHNIQRADVVVLTRADLAEPSALSSLRSQIVQLAPNAKVFEAAAKIVRVVPLGEGTGRVESIDDLKKIRSFTFAGLGNTKSFFDSLTSEQFSLAGFKQFADHHRYSPRDIREIEDDARAAGAELLLTTAKDAVKLRGMTFKIPCFVVEVEVRMANAAVFDAAI